MKNLSKVYPHLLAFVSFIIIALLYFYPVLQGQKIYQSDIVQYTGMAKEQIDFRAKEDTEPYWTNSAFGGMPTYQLGAKYPHNYIKTIDELIRFLPRPADYLMLYFGCFYILLLVLKADPLKAFIGALAFGFSTYLIIILGVGHNAKAHAIAYMPLVIAGILLVFKKRYLWGGILTMLATALEINANHIQMTYYLLFLIAPISIYYTIKAFKNKEQKELVAIFGIFIIASVLALGANATSLLATAEYAKTSTRDKSELTFTPDGKKSESKNAMTNDYITEYSYGIAESFNLIAPRLFGGSNNEKLGSDSSSYDFISKQGANEEEAKDFTASLPTYWGDQPIVAAPAYIGCIVFFLALIGVIADKRKIKYAFLAGAILSLFLSWGKNIGFLTNFCIEYIPMYNKFRAVSSIQVILELCLPVLAIMGLTSFFKIEKETQWKVLLKASGIGIGLVTILFLIRGMFNYAGGNDIFYVQQYGEMGRPFIDALKEDRKTMYIADLLRSGFLILVVATLLWLNIKNRIAQNTAVMLIGCIMIGDLFLVDKNYLDNKSFVGAREVEEPFQPSAADLEIKKDTTIFRVFEISGNMSSARSSFFHQSIGGYSAVKPRRMQQLFDYQIAKSNMEVFNMLNVKYIIKTGKDGTDLAIPNPYANGNAWFVNSIKKVTNADKEMKALDKIESQKVAIINQSEFSTFTNKTTFSKDSTATISLEKYKPNDLTYKTNNPKEGLAIFSEMYYKNGWNAYLDGKLTPHFRADYVLRALIVPAGKHTITFKFEPQVVKTGSIISLISSLLIVLSIITGVYFERKKQSN